LSQGAAVRMACCLLFTGCTATTSVDTPSVRTDIRQHVAVLTQQKQQPALVVSGMTIAQGVAEFYRRRDFAPAWDDDKRVGQLLDALADLRYDGLDPQDYGLDKLRAQYTQRGNMNASEQADFDLVATQAYLLSLVHLYRGKVDPGQLDPRWNFDAHTLDLQQGMQVAIDAVASSDIGAAFDRARPQQVIYPRLRAAMKQLYAVEAGGGWPQIADGPTLKPGMHDARVPILRQRLQASGINPSNNANGNDGDLFDAGLSAAVSQFQREQYLAVDGNVGPATRAALNVPLQARIDQLRANLERGRWLLHEIHDDFVLVDIAGYKVHFFQNGVSTWSSRVQVGKPYRSTPEFKSKVTYITVNPTWTVPPTIYRKDVLPKLKEDPDYLTRQRMKVLDASGKELDPASIDWNSPGNILLRQDAGDDAALGQVVIRFPNPYSIYLHDTPHQRMFGERQRAFSSGCIRVERPLELVERLFDPASGWTRAAIEEAIASGETRNITLPRKIPILLVYWTVDLPDTADAAKVSGKQRVAFKPDVYGRDPALIRALKANPAA
jgi:murein L,D-transpeptidase YcbB/YkuD